MKTYQFKDLIHEFNNSLDKDFCKNCIVKFESDPKKEVGEVLSGVDFDIKKSTDLQISGNPLWGDEDEHLYKNVKEKFAEYRQKYRENFSVFDSFNDVGDTGYRMQKTKPGEYYKWHDDSLSNKNKERFLTFIWYLNDVHVGGYTEFIDGTKVKPEAGKLIFFPSTWTYVHQGTPPISNTKYIITGWITIETFEENGKIYYK